MNKARPFFHLETKQQKKWSRPAAFYAVKSKYMSSSEGPGGNQYLSLADGLTPRHEENAAEVVVPTFACSCLQSSPIGCSATSNILDFNKVATHFQLDTDFLPNVLASAGAHQYQISADPTSCATCIIWSISCCLSLHVAESCRCSAQIQAYPNTIYCCAQ